MFSAIEEERKEVENLYKRWQRYKVICWTFSIAEGNSFQETPTSCFSENASCWLSCQMSTRKQLTAPATTIKNDNQLLFTIKKILHYTIYDFFILNQKIEFLISLLNFTSITFLYFVSMPWEFFDGNGVMSKRRPRKRHDYFDNGLISNTQSPSGG